MTDILFVLLEITVTLGAFRLAWVVLYDKT